MSKQAVLILAAVVVILALLMLATRRETTKEEALKFVKDDIAAKYGAEAVLANFNATKQDGSWSIQADVVTNAEPACPARTRLYYNYPAFGYVTRTPETITANCQICIGIEPGECRIFFDDEAVIASHSRQGGLDVSDYIKTYADARPSANFYGEGESYAHDGKDYSSVWLVDWSAQGANYTVHALVDPNGGTIVGVWKTDK